MGKPTGKEQEGKTVPSSQARWLNVTVKDEELLTQQGILEQKL